MNVEQWLGKENQLGIDIWHKKYQYNNESFDEWLDRVSGGDLELRQLIVDKKFLMGGRTLANRGVDSSGSLFNCYSRGFVDDDYSDIMDAAKDIGLTFKAQGGQGISLTKLRPKGTKIKEEYTSDGIVPFMRIFNEVTEGTSQGGARKGALMLSIDARHKEAETFIKIKSKEGEIEKANLSLEIDDEFMNAVQTYYKTGETVVLHEKRNYSGHELEYDVVPINIFNMLVDNCYDWADPACLFVNRFRNYNLMQYDDDYNIETCNPCGEQPLPKHGACCLASINLSEFIINPYTKNAYLDTESLIDAVIVGVRTLDNLIDENYYRHPLKEQQEMSFNYRNIGLGCFGYATALMKLGMEYGSDQAISWTDDVFGLIFRAAVVASNKLAAELGTFPKYKDCVWDSDIIKAHFMQEEIDLMRQYGLRNCSLISLAPNGSLATLLGESGGCEPEFALSFTRRTIGMTDGEDTYYKVYCKAAREYMKLHNITEQELPTYFVSSADIPWQNRVLTQATMQKHIDTAISSTVNMPNSATKDDIAHMYLFAWQSGCKGITMFRDGCKRVGILTTNNQMEVNDNAELSRGDWKPKAADTTYYQRKLRIGCGKLFLFIGWSDSEQCIQDFYVTRSGQGGCERLLQAAAISMSAIFRLGGDIDNIEKAFRGIGGCNSFATQRGKGEKLSSGSSCGVAILNELKAFIKERTKHESKPIVPKIEQKTNSEVTKMKCPECGKMSLRYEGGCNICEECGFSSCG